MIDIKSLQNLREDGILKILKEEPLRTSDYQRSFAWRKGNVDDYFDDIKNAYLEAQKNKSQEQSEYFLGLIILAKEKNSEEPYDIVDGQQRLLTTWLYCSVLYTILYDISDGAEDKRFVSRRRVELLRSKDGNLRIDPIDPEVCRILDEIASANSLDEMTDVDVKLGQRDEEYTKINIDKPEAEQLFINVLDVWFYLHRKVDAFIKELSKNTVTQREALEGLLNYLNYVKIIQLTVSSERALVIFSTLNARGLDLSTMDLVKAELMRRIQPARREQQQRKIRDTWKLLERVTHANNINKSEDGSEDFFRMFFAQTGRLPSKRKLLAEWKKHIKEEKGVDIEKTCDSFERLAKILNLWNKNNEGRASGILKIEDMGTLKLVLQKIRILNRLGSTFMRPVFLAAINTRGCGKKNYFTDAEILKLLEDLIIVYIRYLLIGHNREKPLEQAAVKIAGRIAPSESNIVTAAAVKKLWNEFLTGDDSIPDNDEFKKRVGSLRLKNDTKARNILILMEEFLEEDTETHTLETSKIQLEHIFPKTPDAEWGPPAMDTDEFELLKEAGFCLLGNLTLLYRAKNRHADNRIFSAKKDEYYKSKAILLNRDLLRDYGNQELWGKADIENRQKKYFADLACRVWPW